MTPRALALRRMSRLEAAALRARAVPRVALSAEGGALGGGALRLWLDRKAPPPGEDQCRLSLTWGADRLVLYCPADLPAAALRGTDPALNTDALPPDVAALLLEAALLPIVTRLEQATGRAIALTRLEAACVEAPPSALALVLEHGDRRWRLLLSAPHADDAAPDPLTVLLGNWPAAPPPLDELRVPVALRIGATTLTFAEFASLRLGDAILFQTGNGKGGRLVVAETMTARAAPDGRHWRLAEAPGPAAETGAMEWTMRKPETIDGTLESKPAGDPDQLPVHLTFDVGRVEMTLGELRKLRPGAVVETGRAAAEAVRISAQGRPVGQGELVDVEGMIGVKITRLFGDE